ncbi:Txe/YoeB family addiction module toxin [Listeria monocytogenes]|nr:Txe/YoeB family addiction module toxin [Listeria monocytogenes]TYV33166.1 Txe/YoeB family addiction module toxin [Listeria monocytogenes]HBC0573997.1 Txe/YoeB family addiction module toxin [Listeria monocytogenes]
MQGAGPLDRIGKPEKLEGNLSGFSSRRIDREHRLVYRVENEKIKIISCSYHYK